MENRIVVQQHFINNLGFLFDLKLFKMQNLHSRLQIQQINNLIKMYFDLPIILISKCIF